MNLDANDLILFAEIMEAGSFAKAAERLDLPKSTLSRRLSQLENRLGERLLTRTTRRLVITEFGEGVLEHARRLQEETEAAAAYAQHRQGTPRGTLRVTMPPNFAELDLTDFVLQFASTYPEVSLELDMSPRRVDLLAERYDLAIRAATRLPDDATLVARRLSVFKQGLYASPAYLARYGEPEHPDDLAQHICLRLISGNGDTMPWHLQNGQQHWDGVPTGPLAANSLPLQRELAIHGMGIVGLNERYIRQWLDQGMLTRVLPDWSLPEITIWAVTPGRRLLPTRTRVFIDMMREMLEHLH